MDNNLLTAIIYDEYDATFYLKTKPNVNQILPITPNAQAILLECGIPFINTTEIYTDYRQARVLARVRRMERTFSLTLKASCAEAWMPATAIERLPGFQNRA